MTNRLRHQREKKNHPFLASSFYFNSFLIQVLKIMSILCTSAYFNSTPEDMQRFEFHIYILFVIKQNFCEPVPIESISTLSVFNKAIF